MKKMICIAVLVDISTKLMSLSSPSDPIVNEPNSVPLIPLQSNLSLAATLG